MRTSTVVSLLLVCATLTLAAYNPDKNESPIWKVFCDKLYGGRVDTIVNPGTYSAHVHRVFGGNNFSPSTTTRSPLDQFKVTLASPCTSCSIKTVDNSNYWTADLYYKWPNNTYSLVPSGGLTVYYLSRGGATGTQRTNPNWQPIPKGLRIVAGSPMRRTYNDTLMSNKAVDYVCLNYNGGGFPQSTDWSGLKTNRCPDGLRTQVFFPMCWDGKNLDSADHASHMAYPLQNPNGGDCPATHPVRIPGVFFEHIYQVGLFPHGDGTNNFVWSMGDNTGYGHHGDFLSGWDETVMAAAIKDPKCSNENQDMNNGNNVKACPPLAPFVKNNTEPSCNSLNINVPLTENLGSTRPLARMPGCYDYNGLIPGCDRSPAGSDNAGTYFIKSQTSGGYFSAKTNGLVFANHSSVAKSYPELWAFGTLGAFSTIQNQENFGFISARDNAQLVGGADTWEQWTIQYLDNTNKLVAFKSNRNQKFLSVVGGLMTANSVNVTATETFILEDNNGGYVPAEDGFSQLIGQPDAVSSGQPAGSKDLAAAKGGAAALAAGALALIFALIV